MRKFFYLFVFLFTGRATKKWARATYSRAQQLIAIIIVFFFFSWNQIRWREQETNALKKIKNGGVGGGTFLQFDFLKKGVVVTWLGGIRLMTELASNFTTISLIFFCSHQFFNFFFLRTRRRQQVIPGGCFIISTQL